MGRELGVQIRQGNLSSCCEVLIGTLADMPLGHKFDSLIYIDVLEHIPDDKGEVQRALRLLNPGGHLIVLSPAHPFLFSPFDQSIGHFRRYTTKSLREIVPAEVIVLRYLDAGGMALSFANRLLLKQALPTLQQVQFWDKRVIPLSRILDRLLGYRVGKSVLGIWRA
jgi:2-polyprenyl-3-methyl-5-hydroxy-6-metoxy-1,4-benzoquinol methylase